MTTQRHIGGRKTDGAATLVAVADDAADGPWPAQFGGRAFGISVLQRPPDAGGGERSLCVGHRGHQRQAHAHSFRSIRQKTGVAAAAMSEREVLTGDQMAGVDASCSTFPDEVLGRHQAEFMIERQFVQQVDTQSGQGVGAFGGQGQAEGRIVGAEDLARMRFER